MLTRLGVGASPPRGRVLPTSLHCRLVCPSLCPNQGHKTHIPMSTEAAAGKNPVSHVGKIYTLLSHQMAQHIYTAVEGVAEVSVWLCSQIGQPVDHPWIMAAQVILAPGASMLDVETPIRDIIHADLTALPSFITQLTSGAFPVWRANEAVEKTAWGVRAFERGFLAETPEVAQDVLQRHEGEEELATVQLLLTLCHEEGRRVTIMGTLTSAPRSAGEICLLTRRPGAGGAPTPAQCG